MKNRKYVVLILYVSAFIFSFAGVITKWMGMVAKSEQIISIKMFCLSVILASVYIIYAIIWQYVLKYMSLTMAYMIKSTTIIWSIVWAKLFFNQKLTGFNLVGILLLIIGINILQKE